MQTRSILKFSSVIAAAGLLAACGGTETAEEDAPEEDVEEEVVLADPCPDRVQDQRGSTDALTCSCTPEAASEGNVWGAGPYSDDSRVCRAAMHAGLVTDEPVNVTVNFMPGRDSYTASNANGVETRRWGTWGGSFAFEGQTMGEPENVAASALEECPTNFRNRPNPNDALDCSCTAQLASSGTVWGTDAYTDDSRICRAAVHAGAIDTNGGDITVTPAAGQDSYSGSEANGVETNDYGRWGRSFTVESYKS